MSSLPQALARSVLALLAALVTLPLAAVEYHVKSWRTADGLPDNRIHCLAKTADGFLWIGTANGLARFDGQRFEIYDARNLPILFTSDVINFLHTRRHGLMFLTRDGLWTQRRDDGTFQARYDLVNITSWTEDDAGRTWVVKNGGRLYQLEDDGLREFDVGIIPPGTPLFSAGRPAPVVFRGGKWSELRDNAWKEVRGLSPIPEGGGWRVERFSAGGAWFMLQDQICRVDARTGESLPLYIRGVTELVSNLRESASGVVLLSNKNGHAYRIHPETRTADPLLGTDGLPLNDVVEALPDDDGNIWVGTRGDGLIRLRESAFQVRNLKHGLPSEALTTVALRSAGGLWLGDHDGQVWAQEANRSLVLTNLPRQPIVQVAWEDHTGVLWTGQQASGFHQVRNMNWLGPWKPPGLPPATMHWPAAAMETRAGDLWLSSATAVFRIHEGKAERFEKDRDLIESGGTCLAEDRDGNVWLACYGGVNIWRKGKWDRLLTSTNTFPYGVFALAADQEGAVWIGTKRNQLSCYRDGRLTGFPLNADTTDNAICGILDDGDGNLWMTTFRGLMRVRKSVYAECMAGRRRDLDADLFGPEDGLVETGSYGPASPTIVRDAAGRIHAATLRGLVSFDPRQVLPHFRPPATRIEQVQLDRRSLSVQPDVPVAVPPGVNQVEIRYTGVQLSQPGKVRFRYKLNGVDPTWVEAGGRRTAYYPRLPHGAHLFEVQAAGPDRAWPETSTTLALNVGAFYWETRWFALTIILGGTALIAWLVRYISTRGLELRLAVAQHQAAVERERARISRDMHDDLGARLTKIAFYTELAERDADARGSREHLHSVARMSREAAQALDEMVWAVKPTNDTLANLANYLCQYATEYLAETPIRLRLDLPVSIAPQPVPAEVRHQVFLVLKEALNNVVKHAEAHEVLLQLKPGAGEFTITLADDGIGIRVDPALGSPTGNGLQNMHQRIHQVGGTVAIGPRHGGGTEIRLVVPLRTEPPVH